VHVRDADGLRDDCRRARALGFRGKTCIHPAQVPVVHEAFAPTGTELAWAQNVVDAFDAAEPDGAGVVLVDGQMVDRPVVDRARRLLDDGERSTR
jgi:citrate lyase subunit beta/citryl-CoA lyase